MKKNVLRIAAVIAGAALLFSSCNSELNYDESPTDAVQRSVFSSSGTNGTVELENTGSNELTFKYYSSQINFARLYVSEANGLGLILANQDMNYSNGMYSYTVKNSGFTDGAVIHFTVLANNNGEKCVPQGALADSSSWASYTYGSGTAVTENTTQENTTVTVNETTSDGGVIVTSVSKISDYEYCTIKAKCSGKVADVADLSTANGGNIHQWDYVGGDNQKWHIVYNLDGTHSIVSKSSSKVLDVDGWSTTDGGNVQQWTDNKQANQKWNFELVDGKYFKITNVHSGKVLDVSSASTENGANIQQWTWNNSDAQKWTITGYNDIYSTSTDPIVIKNYGRTPYGLCDGWKTTNSTLSMLHASGNHLVNASGNTVTLKGTNAGGYLIQEFWMTPTASTSSTYDQKTIMSTLTSRFGETKAYELLAAYENGYWNEEDFSNIANMGMNVIRLPFWWRNIVDANGNYYGGNMDSAFAEIDWFIDMASKYNLYVILDFHGAPGSQNGSDHSGVDGGNSKQAASEFFFGSNASSNQALYLKLWKDIADRYKNNGTVAGYDLLNEPFCTYRYSSSYSADYLHSILWTVYDNAYKTIRSVDSNHNIIMESVWWADDLPNPSNYGWSNVTYEYHQYEYSDYDNANGTQISSMRSKLDNSKTWSIPTYIGEFAFFNNISAWNEGLALLNSYGVNWTTWTYKTVETYGNWGLYHHPSSMNSGINLDSSSYDDIKSYWSNTKTSAGSANTNLVNALKSALGR